jgi:hypothetical protein
MSEAARGHRQQRSRRAPALGVPALSADVADHGTVRPRGKGKLRRSDFGLEWDALREARRLLVADDVQLLADVILVALW